MTKRNFLLLALVAGCWAMTVSPAAAAPCTLTNTCPINFQITAQLPAPVKMVAAGGVTTWALDVNTHIYRWNTTNLVFDLMPGLLSGITVGGGDQRQPDLVMGYNSAGQYWMWSNATNNWNYIPTPKGFGGLVIGKGLISTCSPYEVWGTARVAALSPPTVWRYDFCTSSWKQAPGTLANLWIGGGEIWALSTTHLVYRFNTVTQNSWTQIAGTMTSLAVGADGIWGINSSQQVFQYDSLLNAFVQITGAQLTSIGAGGNGVWGRNSIGQVDRYQAIPRTFVASPGVVFSSLSVGSGAGVWGVDTNGNIRVFVTPAVAPGSVLKP